MANITLEKIWISDYEGFTGNDATGSLARAGAANTVDPDKANCFIALQLIRKVTGFMMQQIRYGIRLAQPNTLRKLLETFRQRELICCLI